LPVAEQAILAPNEAGPSSASGVQHVAVVVDAIDVVSLVARVSHAGVGAISTFLGLVREHNDGRAVTGIDYEAYEPMASLELTTIAREICEATPGLQMAIEHRIGTLVVGDVSVAIVASHARRAPAMVATQRAIETLKKRVPIWKREHYVDGERRWVDPTV